MTIYEELCKVMGTKEMDHWESTLYVKVTPESKRIVNRYRFKSQVSEFIDNIDHEPWYEIPFAFPENFR